MTTLLNPSVPNARTRTRCRRAVNAIAMIAFLVLIFTAQWAEAVAL